MKDQQDTNAPVNKVGVLASKVKQEAKSLLDADKQKNVVEQPSKATGTETIVSIVRSSPTPEIAQAVAEAFIDDDEAEVNKNAATTSPPRMMIYTGDD